MNYSGIELDIKLINQKNFSVTKQGKWTCFFPEKSNQSEEFFSYIFNRSLDSHKLGNQQFISLSELHALSLIQNDQLLIEVEFTNLGEIL